MRIEQLAIPAMRAVASRPKVADIMFGWDKWGNPFGPDRYSYPYPVYDRMRDDGPVVYRSLYNQWFVTGHRESREVLASSSVVVSPQRELLKVVRPYNKLSPQAWAFLDNMLLFIDPPDHTRLRRLVSRAFSPRQVSRIEDAVDRLARRLVDDMLAISGSDRRPVDVFANFAGPLPINVICELLGLPEERWSWAAEISDRISVIGNTMTGFDPQDCSAAIEEMGSYFLELAARRRQGPREDLITELAAVDEDGDRLNDDELISIVGILMFAGHETTSGLLGNSILALAEHPGQRELIRNEPSLWENAVEELLRWDTPLQIDPRTADVDFTVGDAKIKAGQNILVMLGAANRDPDFYPDPNVLRLDREDPNPASFGHGMHHCLGHALARMETRVALRAFIEAFGDYATDRDDAVWKESLVTRGPLYLPVRPGVRNLS